MKIDISIKEIEAEQYLCIKLADLTQLKRKRTTFTPPTIEEVRAYCKERNNDVNVNQWMNHYESNGWMVGKVKMKSWQAAVRTWESGAFANGDTKPAHDRTQTEAAPEGFGKFSEETTHMPQSLKDKFNIG